MTTDERMKRIFDDVVVERVSQIARFGEQNWASGTSDDDTSIKMANSARNTCDLATKAGDLTWKDILREEYFEAMAEPEGPKLRTELIQVIAVAVAWLDCLDRRNA
jgi:hypothetical protein